MDYLDSKKLFRERVTLFLGYVLVAIAIAIAALILLYQAYGFGLGKNGNVIQSSLTFFSSHPSPANIYVNGQLNSAKTNTRLVLPSGTYEIKLTRSGYRDWSRKIVLNGGNVLHFDYPFLFPANLSIKKIASFGQKPDFISQSPDHRWLVIHKTASDRDFIVYDLKNPAKDPVAISLPDNIATKPSDTESWVASDWSDDNQHLLLSHNVNGKSEYILLDRSSPDNSLNLNTTLGLADTAVITLNNKKFDQYYSFTPANGNLEKLSLKSTAPTPVLEHVLAYKSYGGDTILYVTDNGAPKGQVLVKILNGDSSFTVRQLSGNSTYVLDLTKYSGTMYVAVGATNDNRVYIYQDPIGQVANRIGTKPGTIQVLRVEGVNYVSFSANAQFIVAENGQNFGVYDIENLNGYKYSTPELLDQAQPHASWMDGDRLAYVSQGKLVIFDYDNLNHQQLSPADSGFLPAFAPDYKYVYLLAPASSGQYELSQTALLAQADL